MRAPGGPIGSSPYPSPGTLGGRGNWRSLVARTAYRKLSAPEQAEKRSRPAAPAFAVDARQRIVLWNEAAEALLGYPVADVVGRSCYEVLAVRDAGGEPACRRECPTISRARRGDLPPSRDLLVRTAAGATMNVLAVYVVVPSRDPANPFVVHYLLPTLQPPESDPDPVQRDPGVESSDPLAELTPQEYRVLQLLANGRTADEITEEIVIALTTLNNHVQHILEKLGVHRRKEAGALAHRLRLLGRPPPGTAYVWHEANDHSLKLKFPNGVVALAVGQTGALTVDGAGAITVGSRTVANASGCVYA